MAISSKVCVVTISKLVIKLCRRHAQCWYNTTTEAVYHFQHTGAHSVIQYIYICLSGLVTAVAVFRNPNTIPFCLATDLLLNVLFSWLLVHLPSTFFLDVLFFFFPLLSTWFNITQDIPFNWINQPDAATSQVYHLSLKYSSTYFGHPHAHHQELQKLQ